MGTSYYVFNINKAPFNNLKLRQAINYGIDRAKIIDRVLNGQAYGPAINGVVPPTFEFYKSYTIKGYEFNLEKAKKLLAEAGYPNGKGLKEIELIVNSGNSRNNTVAAETIESWREQISICFIDLALVRDTLTSKSVPETEDCVFNSNA
jgi:ABC-type transport system substrate-binding protein